MKNNCSRVTIAAVLMMLVTATPLLAQSGGPGGLWDPFNDLAKGFAAQPKTRRQTRPVTAPGDQRYAAMWQAMSGLQFPAEREFNLKALSQTLPACRFTPTPDAEAAAVRAMADNAYGADGKPLPPAAIDRLIRVYQAAEERLGLPHNNFVVPMFAAALNAFELFNGGKPPTLDSALFLYTFLHARLSASSHIQAGGDRQKEALYYHAAAEAAYLTVLRAAVEAKDPIAIQFLTEIGTTPNAEAARNEARNTLAGLGFARPERWRFTEYGLFLKGQEQTFVSGAGWRPAPASAD